MAALLSVALLGSGLSTLALAVGGAAPATAAPGNPGTPSSGAVVYTEDFENGTTTTPIPLPSYTGGGGAIYTADGQWLNQAACNGTITSFVSSPSAPCAARPNGIGPDQEAELRRQAYALGQIGGAASVDDNHSLSAYTQYAPDYPASETPTPVADAVEFESSQIPLTLNGRFLAFSVDAVASSCTSDAATDEPKLSFFLRDAGGQETSATGAPINPCTDPRAASYTPPLTADGLGFPTSTYRGGTFTTSGSVLFTGSSVGVVMRNGTAGGLGNDHSIDNIRILDVTPQLDKSFSPTTIAPGGTSTLTFTVTNTSELAAKNGWSFTDSLPTGVTLASPTAAATTCPSGAVTAAAGGTSIAVTGNLSTGMPSCTVTVNVTGNTQGTYTNGPANVTETGLNPPADTTLNVTGPVVTCTTDPNIFNTGYTAATGGVKADGSFDSNWQVAGGSDGFYFPNGTAPATATPLPPANAAFVPAQVGNSVPSAWSASPFGNSQWVSNKFNGAGGANQTEGSGDWYYRYQFNLDPSVDPSAFSLTMNWLADNSVAAVWVNGAQQTGANLPQNTTDPYHYAGFAAGAAATTTLNSNWQTGPNTILVQIKSFWVAEGFNAQVTPTTLCPQPAYTVSKTASTTTVQPGGTVTYTVTVTNTGNVAYTAANPASFTDDLTGVLDDAAYNGDAAVSYSAGSTSAAPVVAGNTLSWSGPLAVGETATITYSMTVRAPDNGNHILSNAVTPGTGGTCDPAGSCTTTTPVQSFSVTKTADSTEVVAGGTITYTVTVKNTGQADYTAGNPASWSDDLTQVLDDATYNNDVAGGATYAAPNLAWSGPLAIGATETFTYSVTVNNPDTGDQKLHNAVVTTNGGDCPAGSTDPACFVDIPSGSYTVAKSASTTSVLPGDTITYTVTVTNTGNTDYTAAEPAAFTDDLSGVLDDATYNGDATNGAAVTGTDLSWSGALAIGQTVTVTYSVTLDDPDTGDKSVKNTVRATTGGGSCDPAGECSTTTSVRTFTVAKASSSAGNVHPGDVVTYTVVVANTGTGDFTVGAPASFTDDLSKVLDDAVYNGDATGGATVAGNTLSWSGALGAGAATMVTYSVTVNNPDTGNMVLTNAVVPGDGGECAAGGVCATTNEVASFTVSKTATPTGSVAAGSTISYTVTVTNTGAGAYTAASPASFTDDLSAVLDDATYNNDANNGATYAAPNLTWSGPLAVGATTTVTYSVAVGAAGTGDGTLTNAVTPAPGTGGECDPAGDCSTTNLLTAFSLVKAASATSVVAGDVVTYTITVTNTGQTAYTAGAPASFTDNLTAVLDDATYNGDATNGATYTAPTLGWALAIPVGGTVTVTYSVTVNDPDTGDHNLSNAVVPSGPDGSCVTASDCATNTPVQSYSVAKSADTNNVIPGGVITYTITVTNTGQSDYTAGNPASWSDDLTQVLDDATYNGDATVGATYAAPILSWSGPLAIGAVETFTYSVTVNDPVTGDQKLHNAVVTPAGAGGDCAAGSTNPTCAVDIPSGSYTVAKAVSSTTAAAGDTVTYTVTVTNTGSVAYTATKPASFTDDLSSVLDDATYNGDASNGAVFATPDLTWAGALAVGQTVTVTYSVTVNDPDAGDKALTNVARPTGGGGACDPAAACTTTTDVQSFTVAKASSATAAAPGDVITYTITVTNTGQAAFTAAKPAVFTDELSAVLDDAAYNGDASNGAAYSAPTLAWAVPIPVGGTVTATYSVTVNSPDTGDHQLNNTVVPGAGGECDPAASCTTNDPVEGFTVKKTVDKANAMPGATVTYTVTVANTGKVDYTTAHPASFTDNLSRVLDDASYNNDATTGATYAKPTLSWSGPLTIGAVATITYSMTVNNPDAGDKVLANAVITPAGGNCVVGVDGVGCSVMTTIGDPGGPLPGLAHTGSNIAVPLGILGALLAALGAVIAFMSRRRNRAAE